MTIFRVQKILTALLLCCSGCRKVPLVNANTQFTLADTSWFEAEKTLFVFYSVTADQGISRDSVVELSYETDDVAAAWHEISTVQSVHTHVPASCANINTICGSLTPRISKEPRNVRLRLRYHREGEMAYEVVPTYNTVYAGDAHTNRSLLVYGVFDADNSRIQWRARHQLPTIRNEEATALGLRRNFRIEDATYGDIQNAFDVTNPYLYGASNSCSGTPLVGEYTQLVSTNQRATFAANAIPLSASTSNSVCAQATVTDATGEFRTTAVARKNPEVRPAFSKLHSPIKANTHLNFLIRPCARRISDTHLAMQKQRLLFDTYEQICVDDVNDNNLTNTLTAQFRSRIDTERANNNDMILNVALHHDDTSGVLAGALESALKTVLEPEQNKSSPRATGGFIFDSFVHVIVDPSLKRLVMWCPSDFPESEDPAIPDMSQRSCPIMPDSPGLKLGPFRFTQLPILPQRKTYLTYLERYSPDYAGKMKELSFLAPERSAISENVPVSDYGVATFFNNERITANATDAFSYCPNDSETSQAVFRTAQDLSKPLPLSNLPELHAATPLTNYEIGLLWDFPFLVRLSYQVTLSGSVSAFSASVPFGIARGAQSYYGYRSWIQSDFSLQKTLTQCTRFCDHPTFDSAGVYNAVVAWKVGYKNACYQPQFPNALDGGFPHDP